MNSSISIKEHLFEFTFIDGDGKNVPLLTEMVLSYELTFHTLKIKYDISEELFDEILKQDYLSFITLHHHDVNGNVIRKEKLSVMLQDYIVSGKYSGNGNMNVEIEYKFK